MWTPVVLLDWSRLSNKATNKMNMLCCLVLKPQPNEIKKKNMNQPHTYTKITIVRAATHFFRSLSSAHFQCDMYTAQRNWTTQKYIEIKINNE